MFETLNIYVIVDPRSKSQLFIPSDTVFALKGDGERVPSQGYAIDNTYEQSSYTPRKEVGSAGIRRLKVFMNPPS